MNRRFDRLGALDQVVLVTLITSVSMFLFPFSVAAQTSNQTPIVFEIKTLQIPNTAKIADLMNPADVVSSTIETSAPPTPVATPVKTAKVTTTTSKYNLPPKTVGDARVYMQEPEIRAYICPKLGDKCNIFIAVLKAENGTHECTRDNRGLNRNGSVDIGLAQINWRPGSPYTFQQLQDCKFNLDVALSMYARRGLQPWYAYTKGAYKKHLPAVLASANIVAAPAPAEVPAVTAEPASETVVTNPVMTLVSTEAIAPVTTPVTQ
ncbi:MAG: hypothetical protein KW788_02770 [Candidatus Doudnabacteria bacterium]|nr:hypothetical protein [Candidatus Doudnabacteria bacterium]